MFIWVCQYLTKDAPQSKSASAHPFNQPNTQQGKQKVGKRCHSHQPDGQLVISNSRHLQNSGAIIPANRMKREQLKIPIYIKNVTIHVTRKNRFNC